MFNTQVTGFGQQNRFRSAVTQRERSRFQIVRYSSHSTSPCDLWCRNGSPQAEVTARVSNSWSTGG